MSITSQKSVNKHWTFLSQTFFQTILAKIFFYSTCCGQGTWSLLQRKVRKAKVARLRKSKYVQTEPFRNQHDVQSMIRCTIEAELERITWCRKKSYAKNPPQALTAVLSPSRSAGRAPQGSSSWHGRSRRRGGVAFAARVCSPSLLFFFSGQQGSGYETKREMSALLETRIEASRWLIRIR